MRGRKRQRKKDVKRRGIFTAQAILSFSPRGSSYMLAKALRPMAEWRLSREGYLVRLTPSASEIANCAVE